MKNLLVFFLVVSMVLQLRAQSVSINNDGAAPNASALLDIKSSDKGLLIPRMTAALRNLIPVNATTDGLLVYQTDNAAGFYYYNGSGWQAVNNSGGGLSLPFSSSWGGVSNAFEINMIGSTNNTGIKSISYNTNSKAFFGEARGNNSIGGYFTVAGSPTGAAALQTDVGDVYLASTSGNVGVNLTGTAITEKLQVDANMKVGNAPWSAGNDRIIKFGDGNFVSIGEAGQDDRMTLAAKNFIFTPSGSYTGFIGINTTTPSAPVSFGNIIGEKINFWNTDATHNYGIGVQGGVLQLHSNDAASDIVFGNGSSANFIERARVFGAGGVQVQGPNAAFWFKDRTLNTYSGWSWYANNGKANLYKYGFGDAFTIDQSGNAGIGTTSPGAKLEVAGNIKIADGSQADGKFLISDINGLATWKDLPSTNSAFRARAGASYPVASGANFNIPFTLEDYDQSSSLSGAFFTISATGVYHFDASVRWTLSSVGVIYKIGCFIFLNNTVTVTDIIQPVPVGTIGEFSSNLSMDQFFTAGDVVKLVAFQNSGINQTLGDLTLFAGHRVN